MYKEVIPGVDIIKANKKLKKKNQEMNIEIPETLESVNIKYLEEDYNNTVEGKNRYEEKAKTILVALTIAITLILNLSPIIDVVSAKYNSASVNYFIFVLATLAIQYMLVAGLMSIQVLIKENIIYPVSIEDKTKQDKKSIYIKAQLNVNQNIIRNNIIFSAYRSIRNSVFCLVIIFILAIFPFQTKDNVIVSEDSYFKRENIYFGIDAIEWIADNETREITFEKFFADSKANNTIVNIYDRENDIVVTIRVIDNIYIVDDIISDIKMIK